HLGHLLPHSSSSPGSTPPPQQGCSHPRWTTTFQNTSFADTEGLGLLQDIVLGSLDKHTWSIHLYQPWVRSALPQADWDTIENMIKIYSQDFNHVINYPVFTAYPFVTQWMAGCVLYSNRTSQGFFYVGYNGQDFLSLNMKNVTWTLSQDTKFSQYVQSVFQNSTASTELMEIMFNETCVDEMKMLLHYGRAALERQELPVATVFARTPSPDQLLLVCHVTGFYPRPISVAWLRDGLEPPCPTSWSKPQKVHGSFSLCFPGNSEVVLITGLTAGLLAAMAIAATLVLWVWRQR
uniref:Ig-like domain-containing protein n=1 Tax=Cyanoderma ruficeps TaxID=181631 RepID=A0A8C3QV19_9PASS